MPLARGNLSSLIMSHVAVVKVVGGSMDGCLGRAFLWQSQCRDDGAQRWEIGPG